MFIPSQISEFGHKVLISLNVFPSHPALVAKGFIVFKLIGFYVKAEYHTSEGRIDLVLQTDKFVYIMEFKLDGTAEEALLQINEKHYAQPFESNDWELFKIGVNFSAKTRNIEKWVVEKGGN